MRLQLPTILLLVACSSSPSNQDKTKDTPKTPTSKPAEAPAVKSAPQTEAIAESQPAAAGATVVFVVDNQMAIPLACFDNSSKAVLNAEGADAACAKLVAATSPIKLSTNTTSSLKEKSEWVCDPAEFKKVAFSLSAQLPNDSHTELAVSPPSTPMVFFPMVGETKFTINAEESAALTAAVQKSEPSAKKAPTLHQLAKVDLDGDGQEDTIFSATVDGEGSTDGALTTIEGKFTFSGVFIRYGNQPGPLLLLLRQDYGTYELRGAVDLNGDGRKELILSDNTWEGFGMAIYEVGADGSFKALGDWGCGA